jgi:preprotein translocase subunit YajC
MPVMLLGMLVLMVGMTAWSGRKQKKQRETMMSALKKGDKVITGGGVIGHIVDMNDDEVVLRVEEGRIRFSKSAIQGAIGGGKGTTVTETKESGKTVNA